MSSEPPSPEKAASTVASSVLWRVPLLLPLAVVCGVVMGGAAGWSVVVLALLAAHVLRAWRVLVCGALCGLIVGVGQMNRLDAQAHLHGQLEQRGWVALEGVVVRELSNGCILETGWTGVRVVLRGHVPWHTADVVRVVAQPQDVYAPPVQGMFDTQDWMRGEGVCAMLHYLHGEKLGESWGLSRLMREALRLRHALAGVLMPPGTESDARHQVLSALVLGEKESATLETLTVFRRGGCLHAFAVSGLHVGIVAGIVALLLRLCRVPMRRRHLLLVAMVGVYVVVTGLAVPAVRAYVMLAAVMFGLILRRRSVLFNTWCFAALLILIVQPWQLHQAGFVLSFIVYAGICLGVHYCMRETPWFGPDPYIPARIRTRFERRLVAAELMVRGTVVLSLCAWLVSLALSIRYFHAVTPLSALTNIAIAPVLPVVMLMGLAALVLAWVPMVGSLLLTGAVHCAGALMGIVGAAASHPASYLATVPPAPPEAYMLVPIGQYGRSFCVLGNPGLLIGHVERASEVHYTVEPALFHAGYTPAVVWDSTGRMKPETLERYRGLHARVQLLSRPPDSAPLHVDTPAGRYTLYFSPQETAEQPGGHPIVVWQRPGGERVLYVGNAPMSALESLPPEEQRADVLILGYSAREPMLDPDLPRRMRVQRLILLPDAAALGLSPERLLPAKVENLRPMQPAIIHH